MPNPRLTRRAFTAWLRGQEADAVAGRAKATCFCPIAKFLEAEQAGPWPAVFAMSYSLNWPAEPAVDLPDWARQFVAEVDRRRISHAPITAAEALAALALCGGALRRGVGE